MQTFQHLFLNIPFNVMLALFKIGDGKSIKEVPAIHCFAAGKRPESRHLFGEDLSGAKILEKRRFFAKTPNTYLCIG